MSSERGDLTLGETVFLVFVGGVVGAVARATVGQSALDLILVNALGSLLLGFVVVRFASSSTRLAGFGIGFCGAFTSMSAFAVDVAELLDSGDLAEAATVTIATIGLAVGGAAIGLRWGEFS